MKITAHQILEAMQQTSAEQMLPMSVAHSLGLTDVELSPSINLERVAELLTESVERGIVGLSTGLSIKPSECWRCVRPSVCPYRGRCQLSEAKAGTI